MPYFAPRPRFASVSSTATISRECSPSPPLQAEASFVLHTQPSTSFRRSVSGLYRTPDQQGWYTPSPPPRSRAPSPSTPGAYETDDASRIHHLDSSPEPDDEELDSPPSSACASTFKSSVSPTSCIIELPSQSQLTLCRSSVTSVPVALTNAPSKPSNTVTPRVCDQCRLRKIRCHRLTQDDSTCQTCVRRKKTCTWGNVDPPARRGKGTKLAASSAMGFKGALAQRRRKPKTDTERNVGLESAKKPSLAQLRLVLAPPHDRPSTPELSSPPTSRRNVNVKMYKEDSEDESSEDEEMSHYDDNFDVQSSNAGSLSSAGYAW